MNAQEMELVLWVMFWLFVLSIGGKIYVLAEQLRDRSMQATALDLALEIGFLGWIVFLLTKVMR